MRTDYLQNLQKCVHQNHHVFHFFSKHSVMRPSMTSEGQLQRPFSLLLAILPCSYDFGKKKLGFCNSSYFDNFILFCANFIFNQHSNLLFDLHLVSFTLPWSVFGALLFGLLLVSQLLFRVWPYLRRSCGFATFSVYSV